MDREMREAIRRELERIAFANLGDYITVGEDGAKPRAGIEGDRDRMAAVQAVHTGSNKVAEVKLYDKMKALEMLSSIERDELAPGEGVEKSPALAGSGRRERQDNLQGGGAGPHAPGFAGRICVEVVNRDAPAGRGSAGGGDEGVDDVPARNWVERDGD